MTDITFTQLAVVCHRGITKSMSLADVQAALGLPAVTVRAALTAGVELGYLDEQEEAWNLTERGTRLGVEMESAMVRAREASVGNIVRPYTEFLPTGAEDLR